MHKILLGLLIGAIIGAMIVTSVYGRWPDATTMLLGNVGVLPFVIAVVTVTFLAVNSQFAAAGLRNTQASLEHAQRAEVATRFQKALELIESPNVATRVGGIAVLRDIATQAPGQYWAAIAVVLTNVIESGSKDLYTTLKAELRDRKSLSETELDQPPDSKESEADVVLAFQVLGLRDKLLREAVWAAGPFEIITLKSVALSARTFTDMYFGHIRLVDVLLVRVTMSRCHFVAGFMSCTPIHSTFRSCNFSQCKIRIESNPWDSERAHFSRCDFTDAGAISFGTLAISIAESNLTATNINAGRVFTDACWFIDRPPNIRAPRSWGDEKDHDLDIKDMAGEAPVLTEPGFLIYRQTDLPF